MLIWSSPRGTSLQAHSGILRAGDFDTASDALAILDQAREEREHLAAQARQDAAVLLARARAEAEQLRADAAAEAVDLVAQTTAQASEEFVRRWHAQLADLQASSEAAMARMEQRLAAIVTTAVQRMVMAEPREAVMRRAVLTLRDTMSEARAARLHVHPDDVPAARAALS
ncbi:serine kinase, partial [Streptomyces benahoarensis]